MSKLDKKKAKLQERIQYLETELRTSLTKKTSDTKEISVPNLTRKIAELRQELSTLK
jgi:ribosome-interacting GTPase 1